MDGEPFARLKEPPAGAVTLLSSREGHGTRGGDDADSRTTRVSRSSMSPRRKSPWVLFTSLLFARGALADDKDRTATTDDLNLVRLLNVEVSTASKTSE